MSEQALLKVSSPPINNEDLRGFTVPTLFRRARGLVATAAASYADAARHCLYVIEHGLWRDPQKYGRDVDDPEFNYEALKQLSDREVCWEVIRLNLETARSLRELANIIGWDRVRWLTVPAVLRLSRTPEHAQLVSEHIKDGTPFTEQDVEEILRPLYPVNRIKRMPLPMNENDRKAYERRAAELQQRCRRSESLVKELEKKLKEAMENLRAARDEIADLQSRLYGAKKK